MKRATIILLVSLVSLMSVTNALANIDRFVGVWQNIDPHTGGITKIEIFPIGNQIYVHAWGKCHPTDCDWGAVMARPYAPHVSANMITEMHSMSAVYVKSFAKTILSIHPDDTNPDLIDVESFTKFTDNSGRTAYSAGYKMERLPGLAVPEQLSPANGTVFHHFPRRTTLRWLPVPGAVSYTIEIDCFHCCGYGRWCSDMGRTWKVVPNIHGTSYTFNFVGAQPGRWRVLAVDANGVESPYSDWWEFEYTR